MGNDLVLPAPPKQIKFENSIMSDEFDSVDGS